MVISFHLKHNLQAAAREGARTRGDAQRHRQRRGRQGERILTAANLSPGSFSISSTTSGDKITVTVQATWGQIGILHLPLIPLPDSKVVSGVAVMRKEGL